MKRLILISVLAVSILVACGSGNVASFESGDIVIEDPWARSAILQEGNGAAYMVIRNTGDADDVLLEARTSVANMVEIHESVMMEGGGDEGMGEGEMMQMRPAGPVTIPAGGEVALQVGGLHVMMMGMPERLEPGEVISLTLVFENAGEVSIEAEVRAE